MPHLDLLLDLEEEDLERDLRPRFAGGDRERERDLEGDLRFPRTGERENERRGR